MRILALILFPNSKAEVNNVRLGNQSVAVERIYRPEPCWLHLIWIFLLWYYLIKQAFSIVLLLSKDCR
ncbi:hypothetical protein CS542_03320 [Pedobacter sp. IW39]|nr:hypothetical protein CS542_03320 [Pedobacter sp. IW39]